MSIDTSTVDLVKSLLDQHRQQHLLKFWDELDDGEQQRLIGQIEAIDFNQLSQLIEGDDHKTDWGALADRAELPPAITLEKFQSGDEFDEAVQLGEAALSNGEVGMILVAGGQGSRLGFDHPKGMFPIGPVSNRTLYQMIFEKAKARAVQFDSTIPLYVMTSPPTHAETDAFLNANRFFDYGADDVHLFCQGTMPAVDDDGRLILQQKNEIFESPDGHGGMLAALAKSGLLDDMRERGVQHVFYGQVDNPLIQVCDPALIGYHIKHGSEMTSQVVRKNDPLQRVGNVVSIDGSVQIIEYSDLPEQNARQTNADGTLKLWAGSIAVHVFDRQFFQRCHANADSLPFHRARKKVPFVDESGKKIQPGQPNATKFEKFIFDLLPSAKNAIICEVDAAEGFCAVKNAPGASSETAEHVRAAISDQHSRWLKNCGVEVDENIKVEINPLFAVDQMQLCKKVKDHAKIVEDTYFV